MRLATLAALVVALVATEVTGRDENFLFSADRLPEKAVTPTLANGNIAFVVYGDAVHMNGVYNGLGGVSHRARIPNYANIQLAYCAASLVNASNCKYQLDMKKNMFRTIFTDPLGNFNIVHDVYPHRFYDKAIINKFRIQRLNSQSVIQVQIARFSGPASVDVTFGQPQLVDISGVIYNRHCGSTNQVEDPRYQQYGHNVCAYFSQLPTELILTTDKTADEFLFYTVFAHSTVEAENEIRAMIHANVEALHIREMDRIWSQYGITVEGNDDLDRVLKASSFFLSSSLPAAYTNQPSSYPFYGLSPSGLGRGGEELKEYQGHGFWDTEMWMYPPILLMDPLNARRLLHYRTIVHRAAADNAAKNGYEGWQFVWESAFTGVEVTPDCCPHVSNFQHHITADVAYAARLYYYATQDIDWMRSEGCRLAYETAKFWKSRAEYNNQTDLYDIHRIMGPDEDHHDISNNVFTNVVAAHNLMFGDFAGCLCPGIVDSTVDERREFTKIAKALTLVYDKIKDFHPQYSGYTIGAMIKQADVVLLGYPLEFPMNESTKANNLGYYSYVTRSDGPAMTWAIHTIGHLDLEQYELARAMFDKSYKQYMRAPYNVWSENGDGTEGAGNFITGAGGFLQSIINGYAGVRLRHGELVITHPMVLPQTSRLYIPEINYMGVKIFLDIKPNQVLLGFKEGSNMDAVKVFVDDVEQNLCETCSTPFNNRVVIHPAHKPELNGCKLQETQIGIKVADQDNSGFVSRLSPIIIAVLLVAFTLRKLL
ncbi:protein-glucosylgalactosylhydroxylysine glucosidase-like [Topomyia yanbarensis]|uniref:protein-glucosylgalactosylhydroxylysine glucosidase-like n=1 Tax=Topomyia yanbarensis TaxID=2498891 RepID=UPI00273BE0E9|nr:protein-glucosylgalactosylhydroxylysine glucosidase-like [Topomyia yanbarensis]XP_058818369.1 protein-glucosylgalactosylhydroxylysine glucosidase-like [Topomyia yanbarensis]XP_058818371.1 protein-glucosylgalactosylhydroxylysine glucosidase-like [Topomyia yanbarensis]